LSGFLPINMNEARERGWEQVDFAFVTGDAYVDHSSFGPAIISRVLESRGYKVGMIPQPDWKNEDSIDVFGRPRLGFLISGGNMDPMVNHYTVSRKRRSTDAYTPGGVIGKRPDHATVVYSNLIRKKYKDVPIIMFSALDDVKDKIEGFELGVEDYIVKPFNFSEVLARIRAALRNGELRKHVLQREKRLSTSCTMNESLVEFVEGIPPSLRALRNAAQSLDVKDEEAVSAFTEDVIAETERLIAEAESLSGDAKALRQESASIKEEAHHLEEIDARFQKRFEQAKNDLKDFDGVKK